ncbi:MULTISPECIES: DUF4153 domain-containing protein [unclassified Massilia]|uniref:DUF4153 domain-containing protein n=1 Tax=unclassified Massilia TaxID=2609279 RepID=UPI00178354E0|nr:MULTISPECIES: DUF4153 domain-containing protein [unclassified Massilia]MBD8533327.1 DUF4153 domain-containing protein [Massilia sp. CFBP 13647]MBD8676714.1 DUF4153 domain-containing protein [Massilia sp. CFBP 13721]
MHAAVQPDANLAPRIALLRTSIGLAQGLVLYLLYLVANNDVWPATETLLFAPMLLVALFGPLLLVSALGHLTRRQAMLWVACAAILIAALAVYDIWRMGTQLNLERRSHVAMPSPPFVAMLVAALFIAHALVLSGARDRRRIAAYTTYFDIAWKLGVQLAFSAFFVGITWLALQLGAALFELVKLRFFTRMISQPWFAIPVTAFAFSCAMHLTDVRPAIVQGIRGLLLMLASWILPVFTLFVAGFLASLPFTGLEPLWATRQAGAVLLGTDAVLVILINAAWQNGSAVVARIIRLSARLASLLLVPVTAIAVYALALRVGDHGWTNERIIAAACMLVAGCYALGYAAAVLRPGRVVTFAGVNIGTAFVVLGTALLLFSPLADPARLSVNDQLARLASGKVSVQTFDFAYLRFDGKRFGQEALAQLDAGARGPDAALLRSRIAGVHKLRGPWDKEVAALTSTGIAANLRMQPQGSRLPEGFLRTDWTDLPKGVYGPDCLRQEGKLCDVYQLDLDGDGKPELLLVAANGAHALVAKESADGTWRAAATGQLGTPRCGRVGVAAPNGMPRAVRREWADIEFGSRRFSLAPVTGPYAPCPDE